MSEHVATLTADAPAPLGRRAAPARTAALVGLGTALPVTVVENAPLAARVGVDDGWIERRTGIRRRRHALPHETTASLGAAAGAAALADAGLVPDDVDALIAATCTADHAIPGTAPAVAHRLGTREIPAWDLGAACSGFVTGLDAGAALIESGRHDTVLLVGVEVLSRFLDPADRGTAPIFGDGAGAAVLRPAADGQGGIDACVLGADGGRVDHIVAPRHTNLLTMDGHATFGQAVVRMTQGALDACAAAGTTLDEVDLFVFHQANARILTSVADRLDLDPARVVNAIGDIGNLSAASVPVALSVARDEGRLAAGARVLCGAFGAGLTWGSCLLTWDAPTAPRPAAEVSA